jgi:hypothetical protein
LFIVLTQAKAMLFRQKISKLYHFYNFIVQKCSPDFQAGKKNQAGSLGYNAHLIERNGIIFVLCQIFCIKKGRLKTCPNL